MNIFPDRTLANITASGTNGLIKISANDDATRHKVNIVEIGHTSGHYSTTTVKIQQKACMDREVITLIHKLKVRVPNHLMI